MKDPATCPHPLRRQALTRRECVRLVNGGAGPVPYKSTSVVHLPTDPGSPPIANVCRACGKVIAWWDGGHWSHEE